MARKRINFYIKFLFICITTFSIRSSYAQVHFGVMGGFSSSHLENSIPDMAVVKQTFKNGVSFGGFFLFDLGNVICIQPEFYTSTRGGNLFLTGNNKSDSLIQKVDYSSINVTLLLGAHLYNGDNVKVRILAGPCMSFTTKNEKMPIVKNGTLEEFFIKKNLISLQAGIGFDLKFLNIGARYEWGLSGIYEGTAIKTTDRTLFLTVGIKLF